MDLISINIQRGRDHGIPTYNQIRQLCGLQLIRNFQQLRSLLRNPDDWQRLSQIYSYVFFLKKFFSENPIHMSIYTVT